MVCCSAIKAEGTDGVFTYHDAVRLTEILGTHRRAVIDFSEVDDLETAAMAKLIAHRVRLIRNNGDIRVRGLHGRGRSRWEINRLGSLLPLA